MLLNPALTQLLRYRGSGKIHRWARNVHNPRRLMLCITALSLAAVWLSNAVLSILFRTPYPLHVVRDWVLLSLMAYSLWHVLKAAWKRPDVPIEWHPAEDEFVCRGPFTRREVLAYRLTTVMTATAFKAACASLLLLPELPMWPVGFVGMFLGLGLVELVRMVMEISAHGASARVFHAFRAMLFGSLAVIGVGAILSALEPGTPASTVALLKRVFAAIVELRHTPVGRLWEAVFVPFADVITAGNSAAAFQPLLVSVLVVGGATWLVIRLDRYFHEAGIESERQSFEHDRHAAPGGFAARETPSRDDAALPRMMRAGGAGPLTWRQMVGASRHRVGLIVVMTAPAVLAVIPLLQRLDPVHTFMSVVVGLVFYSFLLLPAALKFDFRRDYDRLEMLKLLPLSPATVVLGQLGGPIVLTTLYQVGVLTATVILRPVSPLLIAAAIGFLLPINLLIYAMENYIFLLSPHRQKQEGIEVFIRTILVFTGKAVAFGAALLGFLTWSKAARDLAGEMARWFGFTVDPRPVFFGGIWLAVLATALGVLALLVRCYRRFDPSFDAGR